VGANAETVEKAVTIPLEEAINGVEGMRYISSSSTNSGTSQIYRDFQDRLQPGYCRRGRAEPRGQRTRGGCRGGELHRHHHHQVELQLRLRRGLLHARQPLLAEFISNYLDVYVKDALKRVPGVGDVMIFGERKYAMRVWLDPARLAARDLTATDVVNALKSRTSRFPPASLASRPSNSKQAFQIPVRVVGRLPVPGVRQHHRQELTERPGAAQGYRPLGQWAPRTTACAGILRA
jgi:HAE1 family hydrophobic/amphiphilic exporter-1